MLPFPVDSDLEMFRRLVLRETTLQEELSGITDREAFIGRAVELGQRHGFHFQPTDVEAALHAARRAWMDFRMA